MTHQGAYALSFVAFFDAGIHGVLDHHLKFVPTMPQRLPSRQTIALAVLVSAKPTQCQCEFLDRHVRTAFAIAPNAQYVDVLLRHISRGGGLGSVLLARGSPQIH